MILGRARRQADGPQLAAARSANFVGIGAMSLGRLAGRHAKTPHVATLSVARHASFLARRAANHAALTPLTFLHRTAAVWPTYTSIVYDDWKARLGSSEPPAYVQTYSQTAERATRLASALVQLGIARSLSSPVHERQRQSIERWQ